MTVTSIVDLIGTVGSVDKLSMIIEVRKIIEWIISYTNQNSWRRTGERVGIPEDLIYSVLIPEVLIAVKLSIETARIIDKEIQEGGVVSSVSNPGVSLSFDTKKNAAEVLKSQQEKLRIKSIEILDGWRTLGQL